VIQNIRAAYRKADPQKAPRDVKNVVTRYTSLGKRETVHQPGIAADGRAPPTVVLAYRIQLQPVIHQSGDERHRTMQPVTARSRD